jgi:peptidoglycan/xylan/chitin deacetylase (PgdA/CDA1 family)
VSAGRPPFALKVDVDTHDGMRDGVPRLLDAFARFGVRASFFLSFGPDNAGKAIWNVFSRRGFLTKMWRTGAPRLYGWRTILSGTLLPARPVAPAFPDLVRRIAAEGHEVGIHGWDHRLWQDHLDELDERKVGEQYARACAAFAAILGHAPHASAAPAWYQTPLGLSVQDERRFLYASDLRGGAPGFPELEGYASSTLQIPTTQPCLEELLTLGHRDLEACARRVLAASDDAFARVIPLHAEVEGGRYTGFLERLLRGTREAGLPVRTLGEIASELRSRRPSPPRYRAARSEWPGRSGLVLAPVPETGRALYGAEACGAPAGSSMWR